MRRMLRLILLTLPIVLFLPVGLAASDWQELSTKLEQSVWASSVFCEQIRGQEVCYAPEQLFDGDPGTCWVEAAPGGGTGEWVLFAVNRPVEGLRLTNGFARSPSTSPCPTKSTGSWSGRRWTVSTIPTRFSCGRSRKTWDWSLTWTKSS